MVATDTYIQTFESIKAMYPNEWVLIGNPELDDEGTLSSIARKLVRGVVLFHSPDKSDMAYKARPFRIGFDTYTVVYTGTLPKGKRFWL